MSTFTPAETAACCRLVELAFLEDFGPCPWPVFQVRDVTTAYISPPGYDGAAKFVARGNGIIAGLPAAALSCGGLDGQLQFEPTIADGSLVNKGDIIANLRGPMSSILGVERTALNFLQYLSGIATLTHRFVSAVAGLPVKILDTRKTIPGWRLLAKYAVRQGGGHNHRMGLYDAVLLKDNHLAFILPNLKKNITHLLRNIRNGLDKKIILEIEVESLEQLDEALPGKPDIILLDNMPLDMMREAVQRRNAVAPQVLLEASGGVNLQTVRAIAETGVDRISIGALTHSAPALDIALDYQQ